MLCVITQFRGWLAVCDVNMTSAIPVKVQFTQMTKDHSVFFAPSTSAYLVCCGVEISGIYGRWTEFRMCGSKQWQIWEIEQ